MPTTLRISREFSLPAEAVSETCAMLAKRGAGNTSTMAVMVSYVPRVPVTDRLKSYGAAQRGLCQLTAG